MSNLDLFNREYFQSIRDNVEHLADAEPSLSWKRALLALADQADRLDAMIARSKVE